MFLEAGNTLGVQIIYGRQGHLFDGLASSALNLTQHVLLTAGHEQDRIAFAAGTAGTTDTVDIGFRVAGHVIVHHVGDACHVQAAGNHIGGDKQVEALVLETLNGFFALLLRNVAIEGLSPQIAAVHLFGQLQGGLLGAYEDDDSIVLFGFQNAAQGVQFVQPGHGPVTLTNAGAGGGADAIVDAYQLGIFQVLIGNLANHRRHGGREKGQLAVVRSTLEYPFHVIDEAHTEHFIGFVEHQCLQVGQIQGATFNVVHNASRGAYDHLGAVTQAFQLRAIFTAAINRQYLESFDALGKLFTGFGHLDSEFTSGGKNQHLWLTQGCIQPCQQWQGESGGFTCASLSLAQQVVTIEQQRDGLRLNRRRLLEALAGNRSEQYLGQA